MPMSTRRQAQAQSRRQQIDTSTADVEIASDEATHREAEPSDEFDEDEVGEDVDIFDEGKDQEDQQIEEIPFPPPGLKEISSLASWTVSTAKPGNGVAALRSPDTSLFWQSDGPQPHLLSIHFFKLVAIVHMRIYLDFGNDESYTPTKIQFLAGTGVHDIQEFAEMSFEQPTGWIDVDFSNVGPILEDDDPEDEDDGWREIDWSKRPVLRAFLVQVRILENHQNGKDTHLRAVQLFARDTNHDMRAATDEITKRVKAFALPTTSTRRAAVPREKNNIKLASWMMDPDLR